MDGETQGVDAAIDHVAFESVDGEAATRMRVGVLKLEFPFMLSLVPLAGAIAAGNTVVLKPSNESAVSTACW